MENNKQTRGRQKIEMKMIDDEEDRLISFSKRRSGIYKKASELSTLCGAEIGILVYSPSGKAFTYGNPSLESVANRFLNRNPPPNNSTTHVVEAHRRMRIHDLNQQYNELANQLEAEKKRGEMLKKMVKPKAEKPLWEVPVDELSTQDVVRMEKVVDELGKRVSHRIRELRGDGSSSSSSMPPYPGSTAQEGRVQQVNQLQPPYVFGGVNSSAAANYNSGGAAGSAGAGNAPGAGFPNEGRRFY